MKEPKTLLEAVAQFADKDRAFEYGKQLRWPGGEVTCPRCGKAKHSFIKTRKLWFCYVCKKQFTLKVGTIFEDSALGLDKWLPAIWMVCNCKNGISSWELHRALGVTQKTAWFMLHRIREAMRENSIMKLGGTGGPVEADEAFIGPNPQKMHKDRRRKLEAIRGEKRRGDIRTGKTAVMGMLDRDTRTVRCKVIPSVRREVLQREILNHITPGTRLYTDEWAGYQGVEKDFVHEVVQHTKEYVRGQVHTQGIENFWSLLKRTLKGTYVAVEPFHLDRYVDEQAFRFNNRATKDNPLNDSDRFTFLMSQVAGKRLTYAQLTGKEVDALHHPSAATGTEEPF